MLCFLLLFPLTFPEVEAFVRGRELLDFHQAVLLQPGVLGHRSTCPDQRGLAVPIQRQGALL